MFNRSSCDHQQRRKHYPVAKPPNNIALSRKIVSQDDEDRKFWVSAGIYARYQCEPIMSVSKLFGFCCLARAHWSAWARASLDS